MNEDKTPRAKNMMYAQQLRHLPPGIKTAEDLASLVENELNPTRYAVIIHDQELEAQGQPKEPDIHAMMSFSNARYCSALAKKIGDGAQYVQAWKGNANNGYAYLIHATAKARKEGKHQYDPGALIANFDFAALMAGIGTEIAQVKTEHQGGNNIKVMLDALYVGAISKVEIEKQLSGFEYAKYHRQIKAVDGKRLVNETAKWWAEMREKGAEITIIWITGPAGAGKTSLAKDYAKRTGQPYFITESSRDIFQNYAGEHTLIIDELRPKMLTYSDLLRITDPHGIDNQGMMPCRYNDRALVCDLIIVTTPYTPAQFYAQQVASISPLGTTTKDDCPDGMDQLFRRITMTIETTGKRIEVSRYDCRSTLFIPVPGTARPNPYSKLSRPTPPDSDIDFFNSMFET